MMNANIININTPKEVVTALMNFCSMKFCRWRTHIRGACIIIWIVTHKYTKFLGFVGVLKMKYLLLLFFFEMWALVSCISLIPGVAVDDRNGVSI